MSVPLALRGQNPFFSDMELTYPRVGYVLTEKGGPLVPIMDQMCKWGDIHRDD